ncbi:MAG: twin-arginine translocase TatA/TatE family subunit [Acidobacteria bacterium]|nr:twin-arginine translocase TatA/TatE family subunit [Acidobacteriota bacterium]
MIGGLGFGEIMIIMIILIFIFGARRLPEIGKSLGEGIKNFRGALTGSDDKSINDKSDSSKDKKKD